MNITIAAVGRMKSGPEWILFNKYLRRITWPLTIREVVERRPLKKQQLMAREANLLTNAVPTGAFLIALDKSGKSISSGSFARLFQDLRSENQRDIAFVIGGTEGIDTSLLSQANLKLSMGAQTWPHLLARCMLLEQIYRVQSILTNHPYHR